MNHRQFMVAMFVVAAAVIAVSIKFGLAPWAMGLIMMPLMMGMFFLYQRKLLKAAQVPVHEPHPELEVRIGAACARAGRPQVAVTVVSGDGRAFFVVGNGQVSVSPQFGDLMTDAELDALLLQEFAAPPNVSRRVWLEIWSVPAAIFVVLAALSWAYELPLYGLGFLLAVIWTVIAGQLGWANRRTVKRIRQAYLNRGGDPQALVSALIKLYNDGIQYGVAKGTINQMTLAQLAGQSHNDLVLLASMGGISRERLAEIGSATGAIPELYAPSRLPTGKRVLPYVWVIWFGAILLMLVFSVLVASWLGGGQ